MSVSDSDFTRRGGLVRPASKSGRFSHHPLRVPKAWHGDFAACGQRSGLLALNLASIFEKLLDQKTFVCLRLVIENQLSNKFASQMWATRPHLGSIFEKLLHRKTFWFACGSLLAISMEKLSDSCRVSCETLRELLLEMPLESGSARLGHIPSLPWESQLPLKPCISLQPFNF